MITSWLLAVVLGVAGPRAAPAAPTALVVATSRGVITVPVRMEAGYPSLSVPELQRVLPVSSRLEGGWADVSFARHAFRFMLDVPLVSYRNEFKSLVGGAYLRGDALFVPMQWLVGMLPALLAESYRYDAVAARFEEVGMTPVTTRVSPPGVRAAPAAAAAGLRNAHKVVIDPGHGGPDPGTRGRYLPVGMQEKHIALAVSKDLADVLTARGIQVVMTRRTDVLVPYRNRARTCSSDCDLFVSVHVNSLEDSQANRQIRGIETYYFKENLTTGMSRVAERENEALRYETGLDIEEDDDPLNFILKDLAGNENLRESADAANTIHGFVSEVHPAGARRLAQDNFAVLRHGVRPSILVEMGYSSNPADGRFLASRSGQRQLATAMADGIIEYLRRYEDRTLSTPLSR